MLTNFFHSMPGLLGLNIEKKFQENQFVICVAYLVNGNSWTAKTLDGFSGDLSDANLVEIVIKKGSIMDEPGAKSMFTGFSSVKYATEDKKRTEIN